jgi:hypothetical protein
MLRRWRLVFVLADFFAKAAESQRLNAASALLPHCEEVTKWSFFVDGAGAACF